MSDTRFGRRRIALSHLDKVLFPDSGITKGELLRYYDQVAPVLLPHLKNRPLTLQRFPDGIGAKGFIQQQKSDYFPAWIKSEKIVHSADSKRRTIEHVLCNDRATLAYLVNQAAVTLHGWLSRAPRLRCPDRLIFDLDPSDEEFDRVRHAACQVAELMREVGLTPFVMTTGSRGLHVIAPLRPGAGFDQVRELAHDMAACLVARHADQLTLAQRKDKRGDRIYLDVMRNTFGQTAVMPYAVRALAGAPVATPLDLAELADARLHPQRFHIKNIFRRLGRKPDPWAHMQRHAATLSRCRRALRSLCAHEAK